MEPLTKKEFGTNGPKTAEVRWFNITHASQCGPTLIHLSPPSQPTHTQGGKKQKSRSHHCALPPAEEELLGYISLTSVQANGASLLLPSVLYPSMRPICIKAWVISSAST